MSGKEESEYEIKGLIGQGAFGKVFLMENKEGEKVGVRFSKTKVVTLNFKTL